MAQLDACLTGDQKVGFNPCQVWQHSFVEIDHKFFSVDILSLPLIQEGQCQFLPKKLHKYWLTA